MRRIFSGFQIYLWICLYELYKKFNKEKLQGVKLIERTATTVEQGETTNEHGSPYAAIY